MTRGDRNNNPGNIEWGSFAAAHGAIGSDGRFAIFPNADMGTDAMAALLRQHYAGLTLGQIQQRWVGSPVAGYLGLMARATGLGPNDVPNMDDPAVLSALMGAMARGEGTHLPAGAANRSPMPAVRRLLERFNSDGDPATGNIWSRGAAININQIARNISHGFVAWSRAQGGDLRDLLTRWSAAATDGGAPGLARGPRAHSLLNEEAVRRQFGLSHSLEGQASVNIRLDGFPRGTHTRTKASGLFKEVTLSRGRVFRPPGEG
jgi:hypothetical protein